MSGTETLILIDAYAQIYRAFYAIRELSNARGEPTNALYGIARLLLRLDHDIPHGYGAVVFDRGRPARRIELLPAYKANRPPMPDALRAQLPAIRTWFQASGWTVLEEEGREADDVIAAIALAREGHETGIVSHDKDLAQLVLPHEVYLLQQGGAGGLVRLGPPEIQDKYGVPPAGLRDYLALLGDSSDNIPGVPGVGTKTAAALLRQFGSIANMLARLDEVEKLSIREALRASADLLRRNVELISLETHLPVGWSGVGGLRRRPPDWDRLLALAGDNQFRSLVSALEAARQADREPSLF